MRIAELGWQGALKASPHLAAGLNVTGGKVTYKAVADALGYDWTPVEQVLG
jgi:alanine dehydrogenase